MNLYAFGLLTFLVLLHSQNTRATLKNCVVFIKSPCVSVKNLKFKVYGVSSVSIIAKKKTSSWQISRIASFQLTKQNITPVDTCRQAADIHPQTFQPSLNSWSNKNNNDFCFRTGFVFFLSFHVIIACRCQFIQFRCRF